MNSSERYWIFLDLWRWEKLVLLGSLGMYVGNRVGLRSIALIMLTRLCSGWILKRESVVASLWIAKKTRFRARRHASSTRSDPPAPPPTRSDPDSSSQYQKTYRLVGHTSAESSSGVTVCTNKHIIHTDLPVRMGGRNTAPQPVELLLASLIGCTQATALFVARHIQPRIHVERMEFDLVAVRDERGALQLPIPPGTVSPLSFVQEATTTTTTRIPSRLQRVEGTVTIYTKKQHSDKSPALPIDKDRLAQWQHETEWRCPVANMMIASGCEMDIQWIEVVGGSSSSSSSAQ
jgi:uncharacterized OsmC-like protein